MQYGASGVAYATDYGLSYSTQLEMLKLNGTFTGSAFNFLRQVMKMRLLIAGLLVLFIILVAVEIILLATLNDLDHEKRKGLKT